MEKNGRFRHNPFKDSVLDDKAETLFPPFFAGILSRFCHCRRSVLPADIERAVDFPGCPFYKLLIMTLFFNPYMDFLFLGSSNKFCCNRNVSCNLFQLLALISQN